MHAISVTRISPACDRSEVRSLRKALGMGAAGTRAGVNVPETQALRGSRSIAAPGRDLGSAASLCLPSPCCISLGQQVLVPAASSLARL